MSKYNVAIAGATGAVGVEMIRTLEERNFPAKTLKLLASSRSAGRKMTFKGEELTIEELTHDAFEGIDIALFSAGGGITLEFAPSAVKAGAVVVDNSSAYRMDPNVPLVVPEVNPEAAKMHKGIIANPNCTTAISLMGLTPLHKEFGIKRIIASTYQAVSGSGQAAIEELENQLRQWSKGEEMTHSVYPHQIAFNALPHVDAFLEDGYTKEEMKMLHESRKILDLPELEVSCTCVRIPVLRAHSVSIVAEFEKPVDLEKARAAIESAEGLELCDDPANNVYPMPWDYSGKENCAVGRLRKDSAVENGLAIWVVGDQLLKGAALNAVQIAELL